MTFAVPFIAAFVMVMWDLTFDPRASTIEHQWIWEQGGGYFGVPLTNYLGWFFTVYLFLQLFALFVRFRPGNETAETFPRSHYAQALLTYAVMGLTPVLTFVIGGSNAQATDAAGVVWQTRSIAESVATVSIYTMLFAVALSAVKLIQAPATAPETSAQEATPVPKEVLTAARQYRLLAAGAPPSPPSPADTSPSTTVRVQLRLTVSKRLRLMCHTLRLMGHSYFG